MAARYIKPRSREAESVATSTLKRTGPFGVSIVTEECGKASGGGGAAAPDAIAAPTPTRRNRRRMTAREPRRRINTKAAGLPIVASSTELEQLCGRRLPLGLFE